MPILVRALDSESSQLDGYVEVCISKSRAWYLAHMRPRYFAQCQRQCQAQAVAVLRAMQCLGSLRCHHNAESTGHPCACAGTCAAPAKREHDAAAPSSLRHPPLRPSPRTQVKVDSVRVTQGSAVVYLRVLDSNGYVIPVHIGEAESNALLKEINKQRQSRPLTHDMAKNMLQAVGYRVTKVRQHGKLEGCSIMICHCLPRSPPGSWDCPSLRWCPRGRED